MTGAKEHGEVRWLCQGAVGHSEGINAKYSHRLLTSIECRVCDS